MIATHACGARWRQIASRTGHCCGLECHRTFANEAAFDAHRDEGVCVDPLTLLNRDGKPRFEVFTDPAGCQVWRSTKRMSPEVRARLQDKKPKGSSE
jgi:hypothetical protein